MASSSTGASTAEVYGFAGYLTSLVAYGKAQRGAVATGLDLVVLASSVN